MLQLYDVSILARHSGRALPYTAPICCNFMMFQSSPGTLAGRYSFHRRAASAFWRFNPRPALWPGATPVRVRRCRCGIVSILARHSGRALPLKILIPPLRKTVSILARHSGRALLAQPRAALAFCAGFNPRPALWPGATLTCGRKSHIIKRFNPRPALWPGATRSRIWAARCLNVSILARHSGRALHSVPGLIDHF